MDGQKHADVAKVDEATVLTCVFWNDVLCSYRKDARDQIMARCDSCPEWRRFEREMDEEDARIMDEIDREQKSGMSK